MHSVKSVKKALTKRLPRYNLRSRKKNTPVIVRDQETQADLSDEDREALFAELPFHWVSSPESDAEVEVHLSPSSSYTYPVPSSSHVPPTARHSTAFSTPNQAEITDFDPRDISVDSDDESFVCPSDPEEEVRDIHTPTPCQVRSYHFSSFFIEHSEEQNSDSEAEDKTRQSSNRNRNEIQLPPLVINSPADLIKLVPRRPFPERDNLTEDSFESSASENEAPSQASTFTNENEEDQPFQELTETDAMSAELLRQLQEQIAAIQAQQKKTSTALETAPIPESTSTHHPPVFHGYDSEDVSRWLNKFGSYLKLRRINPASLTALAELELNLTGPAEDFYYSLPADQRGTFNRLRDALRESFANDNQSWITWQAVSTRQQGPLEPLDVYLTDLTKKFRKLNISHADKMRYFVQGLRSDVRETVLLKQPQTFREAQEMARLACDVKTTMNNFPQDSLYTQVTNLTQTMNSLLLPSVSKAKQGFPSEDKQLMAMMEQNNAILAELSDSMSQLRKPTSEPKVRFASQNDTNQTSVAAPARPQEKSDIQELKELLLDNIQSLDRHFDARIRGLARRNQDQREEIPRQRTREGQPRCFTVDKLAILQSTAPNAGSQALIHCLKNHIPLADLIISHIPVIINHEKIIEVCHRNTDII